MIEWVIRGTVGRDGKRKRALNVIKCDEEIAKSVRPRLP
jgi:hypothetical protein